MTPTSCRSSRSIGLRVRTGCSNYAGQDAEGQEAAIIERPYARDANGTPVPTSMVITGPNTVAFTTQHLAITSAPTNTPAATTANAGTNTNVVYGASNAVTASLQSARSPDGDGAPCPEQRPDRALVARVLLGVFAALVVLAATAPPAGAVLVYLRSSSREVVVARDDGSAPQVVAPSSFYARVSPDGRWLVYVPYRRGAGIRLMSVHGGRSWLVAHDPSASAGFPSSGVAWSPNGRYIAVGQDPYGLVLYDVVRHRRRHLGFVFFGGASFSPDSSRLAFESDGIRENDLVIASVPNGKLGGLAKYAGSPAWGRGGLAFTRRMKPGGLALKSRRSRVLVPFGASPFLFPVEWSREGRLLLAAEGQSQSALHALLVAPSARKITTLSSTFSEVDALSRDGNTILGVINGDVVTATADGAVTVLAHGAVNPSWTR